MKEKSKCSVCNERDEFAKGMCSGCYGRQWRAERKAEREGPEVRQLTAGSEPEQPEPLTPEIVTPDTHLVATNPIEMAAARGDLKAWLERKLTVIERDIIEANAALNEARKNNWDSTRFHFSSKSRYR